ncbi:MAG: 50S ribosomal protein L18 [Candidatus Pacebacteria bacterium]|nr:50S ribosomal protein L18 [Candidatus Paceibacterota bacterium]
MSNIAEKKQKRIRRHARVRTQVIGSAEKPRLSVYRSNQFTYAQLINDATGTTLVAVSDMKDTSGTKTERARVIGKKIAEGAKKQNISHVVFDRGGFKFAGRVKAVAEGAREEGLVF